VGVVVAATNLIFFTAPARDAQPSTGLRQRVLQFDPVGIVLFVPSVICLLLALQWGGTIYPWNSGRVITLLVVFAVSIVAFATVQWKLGDSATGWLSSSHIGYDLR